MKAIDDATRPGHELENALSVLAAGASIEVTPGRILDGPALADTLPSGMSVYVPFLPRADFADTAAACRRLRSERLVPVPHLAPRAVGSRAAMRERLLVLQDAGVDRLLLVAGDRQRAAGPFAGTLELLDSGLLLEYGFRRVGVAGHPEGHPDMTAVELERALAAKRDYAAATGSALWIVTQFVFSSAHTVAWLRRLKDAGNELPVRIGIPGPARLRTLIAYAARCGVSASARVLRARPDAARLLACWTPDGLMRDLAYHRAPDPLFAGVHLFPFGGLARCCHWLHGLQADGAAACRPRAAGTPRE